MNLDDIQLWDILDKMIEGVQIIDFHWRHIYVNQAIVTQSGYQKDQLIGHTMMECYPGIEETPVFMILKNCMENRIPEHTDVAFQFPDKRNAWFELRIQPVEGGIFILSIDITDRKIAEERQRENELEYRSVIEQAMDGIFISDTKGNYVEVNESACKMVGYTQAELLTMSVPDLLLPEETKANPIRFDELLNGKSLLTIRNLRRKDGSIFPVEISAKMIGKGRILGMARDITTRKEAEKTLQAAEERFRKLTETAFDAIVLMNEDGNILFWNRGATLMFGYDADEVLKKPLTMIMPEKYRERHTQGFKNYLRTGEKRVMDRVIELEGRRKDGTLFPIEIAITSWESGKGITFSGIIRDISERKAAENKILQLNFGLEHIVGERTAQLEEKMERLRESEERFQKAFHASAAGISITKLADSTLVDFNEAFIRMTGFSRHELMGRSPIELGIIVDDDRRRILQDEIRAKGNITDFELSLRGKSGQEVQVISSAETILLNNEPYALSIMYDITERKKAQEQLERVNKELEAFSYSVSHDLRAPLRAIGGYSQILDEELSPLLTDTARRALDVVKRNVSKMNKLIDDLLAFAKLGNTQLRRTWVDTQALVESCVADINESSRTKTEITIGPLSQVYADSIMLRQVWMNLISNAIKYSSGKNDPFIRIGEKLSADEITFFIKDNGVGFDMKYSEKLFAVFHRLHGSDVFEGTGVGLSIVKRLVTKHGGKVWAEAEKGVGATFYFTIPLEKQTNGASM